MKYGREQELFWFVSIMFGFLAEGHCNFNFPVGHYKIFNHIKGTVFTSFILYWYELVSCLVAILTFIANYFPRIIESDAVYVRNYGRSFGNLWLRIRRITQWSSAVETILQHSGSLSSCSLKNHLMLLSFGWMYC